MASSKVLRRKTSLILIKGKIAGINYLRNLFKIQIYLGQCGCHFKKFDVYITCFFTIDSYNTRAKRLRMRKVSIFKLAVANANFTTRMPVFELKSNFISIQNFKAGNVKPPGMHQSKDFQKVRRDRARKPLIQTNSCIAVLSVYVRFQNETKASVDFQT